MKEKVTKEKEGLIKKWMLIAAGLTLFDFGAIWLAGFLGLLSGYAFNLQNIPDTVMHGWIIISLIMTPVQILLFWAAHLYKSLWRFVGVKEMIRFFCAAVVGSALQVLLVGVASNWGVNSAYYIVTTLLQALFVVAVRFSYRLYVDFTRYKDEEVASLPVKRAMIIGAGQAGCSVVRELRRSDKINVRPCCIIDDNPNKHKTAIEGVPVVGGRDRVMECVRRYSIDHIYICLPSATTEEKRDILDICKETGCQLKQLPGIYQFINDDVLVSKLKPVNVEDLLGREPIKINKDEIFAYLKDKTILVTGGGGSIGSELCRQIADHAPKKLIIFDIYENNAYEIQQELRRSYPALDLVVLIGSVRDSRRVDDVFRIYRPEIVYHAAAHKHVPLMEHSPNESIKNNVLGTYKTAYAALKYGVKRFVLISTDKAVNPTNIMGASKRLCEMVVQSMDAVSKAGRFDLLPDIHTHGEDAGISRVARMLDGENGLKIESVDGSNREGTQFVAVRFGNVLGSNGSVIPLFKKQIEAGGPVCVTHRDIVRYFMTIPEAVGLVLQAGMYAWGGEIFVLDMGEPVKIDTLARNLIKLSGYKPDEDIQIKYTGLRPGEKLFEEKLMAEEGLRETENKLIFIGQPIPFDVARFFTQLQELAKACSQNSANIVETVCEMVTTFHPAGENPTAPTAEQGEALAS